MSHQPASQLILGFCQVSPLDLLDLLPAGWEVDSYSRSEFLVKIRRDSGGPVVVCMFAPQEDLLPKGAYCVDCGKSPAEVFTTLTAYLSGDPSAILAGLLAGKAETAEVTAVTAVTAGEADEQANYTTKPTENGGAV